MNIGTLRELRADNATTHALLTELIEQQRRTNELLAMATTPSKPVQVANSKPKDTWMDVSDSTTVVVDARGQMTVDGKPAPKKPMQATRGAAKK